LWTQVVTPHPDIRGRLDDSTYTAGHGSSPRLDLSHSLMPVSFRCDLSREYQLLERCSQRIAGENQAIAFFTVAYPLVVVKPTPSSAFIHIFQPQWSWRTSPGQHFWKPWKRAEWLHLLVLIMNAGTGIQIEMVAFWLLAGYSSRLVVSACSGWNKEDSLHVLWQRCSQKGFWLALSCCLLDEFLVYVEKCDGVGCRGLNLWSWSADVCSRADPRGSRLPKTVLVYSFANWVSGISRWRRDT